MKKFLTYICLFSSLLLVLGIGFEVMLRRIPNSYKFKQEIIEKNSDKVKNLIIGSSVTNCSINPAYLADSTYFAAKLMFFLLLYVLLDTKYTILFHVFGPHTPSTTNP